MTKNYCLLIVMTILMHLLCTGEFCRSSNTRMSISTILSVVTKYDSHDRTVFGNMKACISYILDLLGTIQDSYQKLYIDIIMYTFSFCKNITNMINMIRGCINSDKNKLYKIIQSYSTISKTSIPNISGYLLLFCCENVFISECQLYH